MIEDFAAKVGGYVENNYIRLPGEIITFTLLGQVVLLTTRAMIFLGTVEDSIDVLSTRYLALRN
jgi:hypothetical protein